MKRSIINILISAAVLSLGLLLPHSLFSVKVQSANPTAPIPTQALPTAHLENTPIAAPSSTATPTAQIVPTSSGLSDAGIVWQRAGDPCLTASFWADYMMYGQCLPSIVPLNLYYYSMLPQASRFYIGRYDLWLKTYAPFSAQTKVGLLAFLGKGATIASKAEQRMMAEWAINTFSEIPEGSSSGITTPLQFQNSGPESCYIANVHRDGRYRIESCLDNYVYPSPDGYLDAADLPAFYDWMDNLQPFQKKVDGNILLSFVGDGNKEAEAADKNAIDLLVARIEKQARADSPVPTVEPSSADIQINYKNVSFTIPAGLAYSANSETIPAASAEGAIQGTSEYLRFTLNNYYVQPTGNAIAPEIRVYMAKDYAKASDWAAESLKRLTYILDNPNTPLDTDIAPYGILANPPGPRVEKNILPNVPSMGSAAQVYAAQAKLLPFASLLGVRMISEYAQYAAPVSRIGSIYHFEGLTQDRKYLVVVVMPVELPVYSDASNPGDFGVTYPSNDMGNTAALDAYYKGIVGALNAADPDGFNPILTQIDKLVQSIQVIEK